MKLKISYLFNLARFIAVFIFLGKSNSDKKRLKVIHVYLSTPKWKCKNATNWLLHFSQPPKWHVDGFAMLMDKLKINSDQK